MRVGFLQMQPRFGVVQHNVETIEESLRTTRDALVVLPELGTTGYLFVSRNETAALAEPAGGPSIEKLRGLARARSVLAAPGKRLVDFGLRRAHGAEAGLLAARAAYIAGFAGTATALAAPAMGIPVFGTMAHSFVQAHDDESVALEHFAASYPRGTTLLIDTYDTEQAAREVVALAPRLRERGIRVAGVRLDSGDLDALARSVRRILDAGGPADVTIFARGTLDEHRVQALFAAGAPIDGFGIGTSLVWVEADIYEYELPWVKKGQQAHVTLTYQPGQAVHGQVHYIYPYLKEATHTARVRLAFPNPGLKLKPEMFAQVEIVSPLAEPALAIPTEAVLDTGEKQHIFLALGKGQFEPREVKLGVRGDDGLIQILSGLKGGEEVVTSAQFLLDSESRYREAIALMLKGSDTKEGKPGEVQQPPARNQWGRDLEFSYSFGRTLFSPPPILPVA